VEGSGAGEVDQGGSDMESRHMSKRTQRRSYDASEEGGVG
jgi:hypothetical protein